MASQQGREALSVIHITVPRALKARLVRESQARSLTLTDWIVQRLESRTMAVHKIPEALASKYQGTGHALVAITGGQVVDLVYLADALPDFDPDAPGSLAAALADDRLGPVVRQLQALGAVSVCMLSCWEAVEL
jgi:hypothetical protein